jgi:hypothetical protein
MLLKIKNGISSRNRLTENSGVERRRSRRKKSAKTRIFQMAAAITRNEKSMKGELHAC